MRILFLSRKNIFSCKTGDAAQTKNTKQALVKLGCEVVHLRVGFDNRVIDEGGEDVTSSFENICSKVDVIHEIAFSPLLHKKVEKVIQHRPCALSSIYWSDWRRHLIAWRNAQGVANRVHATLRSIRASSGMLMDYRVGCDVVLPNSDMEGECVRRHFKLKREASIIPVPNAIEHDLFLEKVLPFPEGVPFSDYIVCPAFFATRKNQLGLIRALKKSDIPIVFIGDGVDDYYEACRREATKKMIFLGHVDNRSERYWALLQHARCACLASDCETPGIALIEAAAMGARPIVTRFGGTPEYYSFDGVYFDPVFEYQIQNAVRCGWERGRLSSEASSRFRMFTWNDVAQKTLFAYTQARRIHQIDAHRAFS